MQCRRRCCVRGGACRRFRGEAHCEAGCIRSPRMFACVRSSADLRVCCRSTMARPRIRTSRSKRRCSSPYGWTHIPTGSSASTTAPPDRRRTTSSERASSSRSSPRSSCYRLGSGRCSSSATFSASLAPRSPMRSRQRQPRSTAPCNARTRRWTSDGRTAPSTQRSARWAMSSCKRSSHAMSKPGRATTSTRSSGCSPTPRRSRCPRSRAGITGAKRSRACCAALYSTARGVGACCLPQPTVSWRSPPTSSTAPASMPRRA